MPLNYEKKNDRKDIDSILSLNKPFFDKTNLGFSISSNEIKEHQKMFKSREIISFI